MVQQLVVPKVILVEIVKVEKIEGLAMRRQSVEESVSLDRKGKSSLIGWCRVRLFGSKVGRRVPLSTCLVVYGLASKG